MRPGLVLAAGILALWLLLQGEPSAGNLLAGLAVAAVVTAVAQPASIGHTLHPIGALRLGAVLAVRLVTASVRVATAVVFPTEDRLRTGIVAVQLPTHSPLVATLVVITIGMTPGSTVIDDLPGEEGRPVVYVHVLGYRNDEEVRRMVLGLDALVRGAVTPLRGREEITSAPEAAVLPTMPGEAGATQEERR